MVNDMTENDRDVELLRTDPRTLILKYQETIKIIVKKFIRDGFFKAPEFDDVVQDVNLALLGKIPSMQAQYNGISLFRTYFSVIVRNICLKYRQNIDRIIVAEEDENVSIETPVSIGEDFVLKDEARRLRTILILFDRHLPKLLICLKLHYRIPLEEKDVILWYPRCKKADVEMLMSHFSRVFESMTDSEIFEIITPIMNENEGKKNTSDAVRKWTDSKIHEIVRLLNVKPHETTHNEETIKILIDDYFSPFLDQK